MEQYGTKWLGLSASLLAGRTAKVLSPTIPWSGATSLQINVVVPPQLDGVQVQFVQCRSLSLTLCLIKMGVNSLFPETRNQTTCVGGQTIRPN